ncbi:MAG: 3-dehydroquinate synthase [Crocinitomicaceae bacterium]|nr:3-dehydroquinate synthase [Crocinitomicaceae bacterium]MBK8925295.1 3-dehydroquinate synthase [Crocinitomicaceae bacterium]
MDSTIQSGKTQVIFGLLEEVNFIEILRQKFPESKFIIITDEQVSSLWSQSLVTRFDVLSKADILEIPSGEENKNLEICQGLWSALSEYKINRNDVIINLGGGVVTDLGGFVASTFKRGLHFINIPTTLLAQVDASVGGKTGIDLDGYKNQIGLFAEPDLVFISAEFFSTLDEQQKLSGFAEMLKHALIADQNYWKSLNKISSFSDDEFATHVFNSVKIKNNFVTKDFKEQGLRKKLNFGHTLGHAIEGYYLLNNKPVLHGIAVAMGMIGEAYISQKTGLLSEKDLNEIVEVISHYFRKFMVDIPSYDELKGYLQNDKKNRSESVNFTLLTSIGSAEIDQYPANDLVKDAIEFIQKNGDKN